MRVGLRPACPWSDEDELGVKEVTLDTQTDEYVSNEVAEESLRELARRVVAGESLATVDADGGITTNLGSLGEKRGVRRKETRVSELVSIVEIVGEDEDEDQDQDEDEGKTDGSLLFSERGHAKEAMPSVPDAVRLVALYSEHMPVSDAPVRLLDAIRAATGQSTEELVGEVLSATLPWLHDVIVAHVEFEQAQVCSVTLESYDGPTAWERCMGCMELTWLVKHMHPEILGDEAARMGLLHALALGSKDVSYQVRIQSMECLDALIRVLRRRFPGQPGAYARAVSDIVKDRVSSNDDRCWDSVYRCMGHLIGVLAGEGGSTDCQIRANVEDFRGGEQSKLIAELFEHGVGMAQRNRHSLVYASVWLDTLGAEMEALGVDLMHHRPVLVPMLVDWAKALHTEVRLGALRCLLVYVQQCWPRNRSVEAMIRNDLQEIRDAGSGDEACVALLDGIDVALRWT